jgi:hypothetical protein
MRNHASNRGPRVSFDRPELSPCLQEFPDATDPAYREALSIIRAGQQMLLKRPRADMPGFTPCETDRRREQKYITRELIELRNRAAISNGEKLYDRGG